MMGFQVSSLLILSVERQHDTVLSVNRQDRLSQAPQMILLLIASWSENLALAEECLKFKNICSGDIFFKLHALRAQAVHQQASAIVSRGLSEFLVQRNRHNRAHARAFAS